MNKKSITFFSVMIILVFIGYMIFDSIQPEGFVRNQDEKIDNESITDSWKISGELKVEAGSLRAVTVSQSGNVYLGGDSFVNCYDNDLNLLWNLKTPYPVTSLSDYGDTIFASTMELILIISSEGEIKDEWGPFEDKSIITSVSSNSSYVVFADAGNKMLFILDKNGVVQKLIGQNDRQFILPSPYFDAAIDVNNTLFIANTGHRRVETRNIDGELISYFGEPGTAPGAFSGCCNPAHFILTSYGFVTAEKGINRIKILNKNGEFTEFVSSKNKFTASIPLDLASGDGKTIYAANPADSKLYIFTRK
ncbi:MAG TPA: hypothetical protein VFC41_01100 [Anaerovoracaceae bacterium]|nr:hypothetical protein [Anaerovoracaceae bacterium]